MQELNLLYDFDRSSVAIEDIPFMPNVTKLYIKPYTFGLVRDVIQKTPNLKHLQYYALQVPGGVVPCLDLNLIPKLETLRIEGHINENSFSNLQSVNLQKIFLREYTLDSASSIIQAHPDAYVEICLTSTNHDIAQELTKIKE